MAISLLAHSLVSSSRSCRCLFSLIICHLKEAASTTVMSSEVPVIVASVFEMPYMESFLASWPFWLTAFSTHRVLFLGFQLHDSSFWGVGGGLSKSRKFSDLSLSISTWSGVFSAIALKGIDCIRSRSACLENGILATTVLSGTA